MEQAGGVQKRLSGLASIDHTENGTPGEGPCKREENMSLCEHYASSSYQQSRVAQWPACWAHNPKVRGSKPRSAIDYTTRTRRVGGSHANAHADVRTGVHVHADTTRHARTNARALEIRVHRAGTRAQPTPTIRNNVADTRDWTSQSLGLRQRNPPQIHRTRRHALQTECERLLPTWTLWPSG